MSQCIPLFIFYFYRMKTIILSVSIVLLSFFLVGCTTSSRISSPGDRPRDQGIGGYTLTAEQKSTCGITVQVTEWPYYIKNTPQLIYNDNNTTNLPWVPYILTGKVYWWLDNTLPLSGAKIEIRHADSDGKYHPQSNGDYSDFKSSDSALRWYVLTDSRGDYYIKTIMPALYEGRARHIHVRVSAKGYNPVITQLILPQTGDTPTPENDTVAQWLPNCQIISEPTNANSYTTSFDFRLKAE